MKWISILLLFINLQLVHAENEPVVDFITGDITIDIDPDSQRIEGVVDYSFIVSRDTSSISISVRNIDISEVLLHNESINFEVEENALILKHNFNKGRYNSLVIKYKANLKKAVYFIGWQNEGHIYDAETKHVRGGRQVWTQGQGKYSSNWVPSFDDMTEKVVFDLTIGFKNGYQVIANGVLMEKEIKGDKTYWHFNMKEPMSSYLLAFAIGDYREYREKYSQTMDLKFYYYPEDSLKVEPTFRYSKRILELIEKETGYPFPWQEYKQVPVKDFLYAGMENTSVTLFSDSFVTDSIGFIDKNYVNVNAHELAHQWFGDLVTEVSGTHHWLHEGFATFYALLAERDIFGEDYYYWKLFQSRKQLLGLSQDDKGERLLDPHAGSLTFYEKGAWALHILREMTGHSKFREIVSKYLKKHAYKNVTTDDFLEVVAAGSEVDISSFRKTWLENEAFPEAISLNSLKKNPFINTYLELDELGGDAKVSFARFSEILSGDGYFPLKQLAVAKGVLLEEPYRSQIIEQALTSSDLKVRQALATYLIDIPDSFQLKYLELLDDKSYVTIENALYRSWITMPDKRLRALKKTESVYGFSDLNVRTLWLTLALLTPGITDSDKREYYKELTTYTAPNYHFEIREHAFRYLLEIKGFNEESLSNLIEGCMHHTWQFSRFSRSVLDQLLADVEIRKLLRNLTETLDASEKDFLTARLAETEKSTLKTQ
ncbi:M1 family metallopeptidase [Robertkochia solimangrovi]|uniref:M1 family metallopeptidase n=1 Tax=Robertkochia solimangrovi TaxID=2213046 RepID=UPI00117CAE21|nr:M1 family metallopeptidase [Robertkochia solimangrovi]TRZ45196.1 M1 family peptidase [Robertkochia solimangrovi]